PDVAQHLLGAAGRRAGRVGADGRGPQRAATEVGNSAGRLIGPPRVAAPGAGRRVPGAGLLPLHLGGQPGAGPGRLRLGLEIADMLDGFVGGDVLDVAEPGAGSPIGIPELRRVEPAALAMLPAAVRPPPWIVVAAVVDEVPPFAVGDRNPADAERRHVDD